MKKPVTIETDELSKSECPDIPTSIPKSSYCRCVETTK